jgi:hypothetical protein
MPTVTPRSRHKRVQGRLLLRACEPRPETTAAERKPACTETVVRCPWESSPSLCGRENFVTILYLLYHLKNTKRFRPNYFGVGAPRTPTLRASESSLIRYKYENLQAPFNWVIAQRQIGTRLTGRSPDAQAEALSISLMLHVAGFSNAGHGHGRGSTYRCL